MTQFDKMNIRVGSKSLVLCILIIVGLITPFISAFAVLEFFYLLVPFSLLFISTAGYLVISFFVRSMNTKRALFAFSLLPVFIVSQLISVQVVNKIQKFRSELIIKDVLKVKKETGEFPEKYDSSAIINYQRSKDKNSFTISYPSGFMVTERYDSENQQWKRYGWND
jgi:phosphoglycerol transferase MdoB-like AlkP superfamily enzyme